MAAIGCVLTWVVGLIINGHDRHFLRGSDSCEHLENASEYVGNSRKCVVDLSWTSEGALQLVVHQKGCPRIEVESWHFSVSPGDEKIVSAFHPSGFGRVVKEPFTATFPSMQFTGLFLDDGCIYFGVKDPRAIPKKFRYDLKAVHADFFDASFTSLPLRVATIPGNCSWLDLADIYKDFAKTTSWYAAGKSRRNSASHQLARYPVWINTHWQSVDVLERTGGNPNTVRQRVEKLRSILPQIPFLLHWYEWDMLGYLNSNYSECPVAQVCGFDSHYPEYFPARDNFTSVVEDFKMQDVHVVPYLNGRIYDQQLVSWNIELSEAQVAAAKGRSGQFYYENYGNGVNFSVMCPATSFWENSLSNNVKSLLDANPNLFGVYIDQIGAAEPVLCYDKNHSHAPGDGSAWTSGYQKILKTINLNLKENQIIMTESNVEQLIGSVDAFLTLPAYEGDLSEIVPAFQYVYPGMFSTGGAFFVTPDLTENHGIVFLAKLIKQFLYGSHLGWFSLGGNDMQVPSMAMLDALTSPLHQETIDKFIALANSRMDSNVIDYFSRGALVTDVGFDSSVWTLEDSALLIICNPTLERRSRRLKLDFSNIVPSATVDVVLKTSPDWIVVQKNVPIDNIFVDTDVEDGTCLLYQVVPSEITDVELIPVMSTY